MVVYHLKSETYYKKYTRNANYKLIIVMLSGKTCDICRQFEPHLDQLSYQFPSILFLKVYNDEVPKLFRKVKIVPTFQFFKNGQYLYESYGADMNKLYNTIRHHG